ncbi:MAG: heme-degrading domain-containing protein [Clostridia bacterium]|nr:heme-degrading domain-containing protein [Clostridia bacterium]
MENYDDLLKEFEQQERELQFTEFTSVTALKIGLSLIEKARKGNKIITIDITRNGHQLFHYSFDGTSPDNDQWVIRKSRVANRFNKSSLHVGTLLLKAGKTIEEKYLVSSMEYAPHGGSFPIFVRSVGVVGTITVSGLPQKEDHDMVVAAIKEYLQV